MLLFSCCPYSLLLFFRFSAGKTFHRFVLLLQSGILCCCSPAVHILCFCSSVSLLARHSKLLLSCFNPVFFASVLLLSRYSLLLLLCFPAFKSFHASILLLLKYSLLCYSAVRIFHASVHLLSSYYLVLWYSLLLFACCQVILCFCSPAARYSLLLFS